MSLQTSSSDCFVIFQCGGEAWVFSFCFPKTVLLPWCCFFFCFPKTSELFGKSDRADSVQARFPKNKRLLHWARHCQNIPSIPTRLPTKCLSSPPRTKLPPAQPLGAIVQPIQWCRGRLLVPIICRIVTVPCSFIIFKVLESPNTRVPEP